MRFMKTNYRFFYVMILTLGFCLAGCDDSEDPSGDEPTDQVGDSDSGSEDANGMYFPPTGNNDWKTVSGTELGWDTTNLNEAIRYAKENNSYNLLILHKGKIVVEKYWQGTNVNTQHPLESVSKSMMAVVIGILQENGTISLDDKVSEYLPQGWSLSPDTEAEITIRHLLTMTSGLNDKLEYTGIPGETWRYSNHAYKVLYDVIKAATGGSARDYFSTVLLSKIGMSNFTWSGTDLSSSAREISRFGLMMLNNGVWRGEKIINDDGYFSDMLSPSNDIQHAYGYLWWLNGTDTWYHDDSKTTHQGSIASTMPSDSWLAKGFEDQRIYVVPSQDLVVIRQGGYTGLPDIGEGSFDVEFWKRLMKAVGTLNPQ
jgi:CubicO group peptidase (beta-lactamase class C family)